MEANVAGAQRVAVVILNWNGERLLSEFLPSMVEHTPHALARVIVADNGSDDGSLALLRSRFPQVEVMAFDTNHGFAKGYNLALERLADMPLAVLLNSDVAVGPGWLEPLVEFMDTHPCAAACQPKILSYAREGMFEYAGAAGGFIDRNGYPYCRGRIFDEVEPDNGQYDDAAPVDWASGACLMVRTADYRAAGGLDPLFFAHMEEIDLCWRLRRRGREVWAVGASSVRHLGGASLPQGNPRKTYLNFRNNLLMLRRNLPPRGRGRKLVWRRLLDSLAFARCLAVLDWPSAKAILKAHADYRRLAPKLTMVNTGDDEGRTPNRRPNILMEYYLRGRRRFSRLPAC